MADDKYEGFAERYDLFYEKFDEHDPAVSEFYRKLFTENGVQSVLDCACGTGRDLILLNSLGFEVYGSDISEAMLAQAYKNLNRHALNLPLQKVDFRGLHKYFDRQFDAVICMSTSITEMQNEVDIVRGLRSMHHVLRRGGMLVLSQGTTDKQWDQKPRFISAVNTKDFSRVFVIDYIKKGARYNVLDIFHSEEANDFKIWSMDYARIFLKDDLENMLRTSGFRSIDFYGSYRLEPYSKQASDILIAVATK